MDDLPLFPRTDATPGPSPRAPSVSAEEPSTYSVLQLNQAINRALAEQFPAEIWVRGEITGLDRSRAPGRRHWYFELVEKAARKDDVAARVSVALLEWNRVAMPRDEQDFMRTEAADGREVRVRVRVDYYAPWGKLQLQMTGVDPAYTLGKLAQSRERILRALAAEQLLEKNRQVPLPLVPLRIGLITSVGSAAYNDFVQELQRSGYGFRIQARDVRVQGEQTEPSVVAALRDFARRRPDVVAIIRGGGSRSDLAWFDSEQIARAIAAMPVPVLTGIGHEIDRSVADEVAHQSFKTPTACGAFLVERIHEFTTQLRDGWAQVATLARGSLEAEGAEVVRVAQGTGRLARAALRAQQQALAERARRAGREAPRVLAGHSVRLSRRSGAICAAGRLRLVHQTARMVAARRSLGAARLLRPLDSRRQRQDELAVRLLRQAAARAQGQLERLLAHELRVRALDPQRVLARGFSLTRGQGGRLVRSIDDVGPGAMVTSVVADGELDSRVERTRRATPPPSADLPHTPEGESV